MVCYYVHFAFFIYISFCDTHVWATFSFPKIRFAKEKDINPNLLISSEQPLNRQVNLTLHGHHPCAGLSCRSTCILPSRMLPGQYLGTLPGCFLRMDPKAVSLHFVFFWWISSIKVPRNGTWKIISMFLCLRCVFYSFLYYKLSEYSFLVKYHFLSGSSSYLLSGYLKGSSKRILTYFISGDF